MSSALGKLTGLAVELISIAGFLKYGSLPGWQDFASVGGSILFVVLVLLLGVIFHVPVLGALAIGSGLTAMVMMFVYPVFGLFMVFMFIALVGLSLLAYL